MATIFLSTARTFYSSLSSSSSSSSATTRSTYSTSQTLKGHPKSPSLSCKAGSASDQSTSLSQVLVTKRSLALSLTTTFSLFLAAPVILNNANAAILEADDDLELLEKVKQDRKKRLEKQGVISSANNETESVQELVYKLSKVGKAIEENDLLVASSVLGPNTDSDWVQKANEAFNKLSSNEEEKSEVSAFNSSLATLISSVTSKDIKSSKIAFVSSATALEKWTVLTGLVEQLKGL